MKNNHNRIQSAARVSFKLLLLIIMLFLSKSQALFSPPPPKSITYYAPNVPPPPPPPPPPPEPSPPPTTPTAIGPGVSLNKTPKLLLPPPLQKNGTYSLPITNNLVENIYPELLDQLLDQAKRFKEIKPPGYADITEFKRLVKMDASKSIKKINTDIFQILKKVETFINNDNNYNSNANIIYINIKEIFSEIKDLNTNDCDHNTDNYIECIETKLDAFYDTILLNEKFKILSDVGILILYYLIVAGVVSFYKKIKVNPEETDDQFASNNSFLNYLLNPVELIIIILSRILRVSREISFTILNGIFSELIDNIRSIPEILKIIIDAYFIISEDLSLSLLSVLEFIKQLLQSRTPPAVELVEHVGGKKQDYTKTTEKYGSRCVYLSKRKGRYLKIDGTFVPYKSAVKILDKKRKTPKNK